MRRWVLFVAARIAHGLFYVGGLALARSAAWAVGIACAITLLVMAARAAH